MFHRIYVQENSWW